MKRMLSIILVLALIWCNSPLANAAAIQHSDRIEEHAMVRGKQMTGAIATSNNNYDKLSELAKEHICVCDESAEKEGEIVYSNLQEFFMAAREYVPMISDEELASFIVEYLNLDVDEEAYDVIEILQATEVVSSTQFFMVTEQGKGMTLSKADAYAYLSSKNSADTRNTWVDGNQLMQIEYRAIRYSETADGIPYYVYANYNWLEIPTILLTDMTGIAYTGVYDDSYRITSNLDYSASCAYCGKDLTVHAKEVYGNGGFINTSQYIEFDFSQSHAIGAAIDLGHISCFHTLDSSGSHNYARINSISSYLGFQILVTEPGQMKPGYSHTTFGIEADIGVSVNEDGVTFNFVPIFGSTCVPYIAVPITLRVS